jgi:cell division protein WhiA
VSDGVGFTSEVRLELASLPLPSQREARAELAGMLLASGNAIEAVRHAQEFAELRPGDLPLARLCDGETLRLDVPSSAVARRAIALVQRAIGLRPRLTAISTTARRHHGPAYRVTLPARAVREREAGRGPRDVRSAAGDEEGPDAETTALLRGAVLVGGSFSAPDRAVHLELSGIPDGIAPLLIAALGQVVPATRAIHDPSRRRVVLKSGDAVADVLAALGATRAFLTFDDRRLRRQLRGEANRLANADAANLGRIARSAGAQVDAIESAVDRGGWEVFAADVRGTALARLANPSASVSELAELLGVPRTTLHRRLQRIEEAARTVVAGPSARVGGGPSDSVEHRSPPGRSVPGAPADARAAAPEDPPRSAPQEDA